MKYLIHYNRITKYLGKECLMLGKYQVTRNHGGKQEHGASSWAYYSRGPFCYQYPALAK